MLSHISAKSSPQVPNFNLFCATDRRFRVKGHFEKSALNNHERYDVKGTTYILVVPMRSSFPPLRSMSSYFLAISNISFHIMPQC